MRLFIIEQNCRYLTENQISLSYRYIEMITTLLKLELESGRARIRDGTYIRLWFLRNKSLFFFKKRTKASPVGLLAHTAILVYSGPLLHLNGLKWVLNSRSRCCMGPDMLWPNALCCRRSLCMLPQNALWPLVVLAACQIHGYALTQTSLLLSLNGFYIAVSIGQFADQHTFDLANEAGGI